MTKDTQAQGRPGEPLHAGEDPHVLDRRRFLASTLAVGAVAVTRPLWAGRAAPSGAIRHPDSRTTTRPAGPDHPTRAPAGQPTAAALDPAPLGSATLDDATTGYLLPTPVYGGELQYFRMTPSAVPARLAVCQQAACTVIQTYVPWNVHESVPGRFDFTGRTHPILVNDHHLDPFQVTDPVTNISTGGLDGRLGIECNTNLQAFLQECQRDGFSVILRPGPFISDEWRNGGIPDWFLESAPSDAFVFGPDGTPLTPGAPFGAPPKVAALLGGMSEFYFPAPSYRSPVYLAAARRWLQGFAAFVRPWLATNGGPVVAVQVDDETCYYYNFAPFEVDYNPAMVAAFRTITGYDPPTTWPEPGPDVTALRPAFEWQRFKGRVIGEFLGTLAADLRDAGVDVPITHEIELQLSPPADITADARHVLVNPELYPGSNGPEAIPLIELTANAVRAAQRNRITVWSAETQAGQPLLYTLLLGEGIVGALQFDYTEGVADSAVTGTAQLGRALRLAGRRLTGATRRADVAIVWDNDLTAAPYQSQRWGFATDVRAVIEEHLPALATALIRGGYGFDLLDVHAATAEDYQGYRTIFLPAADIVPSAAQQHLVDAVAAGVRLVCWSAPPTLDDDLSPCTTLADACFGVPLGAFRPADPQTVDVLGHSIPCYLGVQTFDVRPTDHVDVVATVDGLPCGYRRRVGSGEAILLGTWPAAGSVPGRGGAVLEEQSVPAQLQQPATIAAGAVDGLAPVVAPLASTALAPATAAVAVAFEGDLRALAQALVTTWFGPEAATHVPTTAPAGPVETLIIYYQTEQRRGGEYIAGGSLAYFDGDHVVGMLRVNTAETAPPFEAIPFRPADAAHCAAIAALAGVAPTIATTDRRVQARVLDGPPTPGAPLPTATVVACNRWSSAVDTVLTTVVGGRTVRLPTTGVLSIPSGTGLVLPVGYDLGGGVTVTQATTQLLDAAVGTSSVDLAVLAPGGGEVVVSLPGPLAQAEVDGRPQATRTVPTPGLPHTVAVDVPAGEHTVVLRWTDPAVQP